MKIPIGLDDYLLRRENKRVPVVIDTDETINGHMLFMGKSGTGKTVMLNVILNSILSQAESRGVRIHIMDVHGDIDIPGSSTVKFSESSPYGFNPLLINPDPDFGGVRKRVQGFISALNKTQRRLGARQESCLRNLLIDLYSANGFKQDKFETWKLNDGIQRKFPKKNPTLIDAHKFAEFKLRAMVTGAPSRAMRTLEDLNRKHNLLATKRKNLAKAGGSPTEDIRRLEEEVKKTGDDLIDLFTEYVHAIQTGNELDDLIKYDSKETLKAVTEKLDTLIGTGIYKEASPPFDQNSAIWRYDIKALGEDEKVLFVLFRLEEIFARAIQSGTQKQIREIIVLDEAHNFFSDEGDNIVNKIAKESRKFGIALLAASQSPNHFSEDFLTNVGTKIITGLDETFWDQAVRKLKIENRVLEFVVPLHSVAIQINNKGELKSRFRNVNVREAVMKIINS